MREIWGLQPRLEKGGRGALRAMEHLRFRAGYDFLLLRVEAGELPEELGRWWTEFVEGDAATRERLLEARPGEARTGTKRRRRRRSGRRAGGEGGEGAAEGAPDAGDDAPDAPGDDPRWRDPLPPHASGGSPRSGEPPA
jgi:poly(A) polymerase